MRIFWKSLKPLALLVVGEVAVLPLSVDAPPHQGHPPGRPVDQLDGPQLGALFPVAVSRHGSLLGRGEGRLAARLNASCDESYFMGTTSAANCAAVLTRDAAGLNTMPMYLNSSGLEPRPS